jgi:hypothetical protein
MSSDPTKHPDSYVAREASSIQIDEPCIRSLSYKDLIKLSKKLLNVLKEARDHLN